MKIQGKQFLICYTGEKWERGKDFGKWVTCGKYWRIRELKRQKGIVKCNWELKKMVQIVENLEWELLKYVEIRKSIYARITNTRFVDPTYFTSTFISNSANGLVSGEVLCDTLRLVWCVCVRPSLYPLRNKGWCKICRRRRTNGRIKGRVGTVWGKWERGKDFGKWVTCGKYWRIRELKREKICDFPWYRRNSRKGGPQIECLWYGRI
jgi:hypothetical protein